MKKKFKHGDVVNWNPDHPPVGKYIPGPFLVIRSAKSTTCGTRYVVSVVSIDDGEEPRHNGMTERNTPAPFGGNNWDQDFFVKDEFLTQVRGSRKRVGSMPDGKSDLRP